MLELASQIEESAAAVRGKWRTAPRVAIILGSGLGDLARDIASEATLDYAEIPHFPHVTAMGHQGRLVCGRLEGVPVVAFQGRFHLYEGHEAAQTALPVRLAKVLGAEVLIVSNAAGGVNPRFQVGDVMLIEDQINFLFDNPLVGVNDDRLGPRFPDMSAPYDRELMQVAVEIARRENIVLHQGVYMAMLGPTYETRAEYRMVRQLGGDAAGMSTVPEVLAARHAGMRVLGLSLITNIGTNIGSPDAPAATSGHDVLAAAATAAGKLTKIVRGVIKSVKATAL